MFQHVHAQNRVEAAVTEGQRGAGGPYDADFPRRWRSFRPWLDGGQGDVGVFSEALSGGADLQYLFGGVLPQDVPGPR